MRRIDKRPIWKHTQVIFILLVPVMPLFVAYECLIPRPHAFFFFFFWGGGPALLAIIVLFDLVLCVYIGKAELRSNLRMVRANLMSEVKSPIIRTRQNFRPSYF